MSRLRVARKGLSFYDANKDRLVTESGDLLAIKERIEERYPGVFDIYFDTWEDRWVIVEHCADGIDRLFGTTDRLDQRLLDRLARSDQASSHYVDMIDAVDEHNNALEKDHDRRFSERIEEFGERLIHALHKDGFMNHDNISR